MVEALAERALAALWVLFREVDSWEEGPFLRSRAVVTRPRACGCHHVWVRLRTDRGVGGGGLAVCACHSCHQSIYPTMP